MRHTSSKDVAEIAQLWEPVHIINMDDRSLVGSIPRDVAAPNHMHGFSLQNRELLKSLFEKAFANGCQHVGFISPEFLYDTMYNTALDVAEYHGGDWQVSPLERDQYDDLIYQVRLKMLAETAISEEDAEIAKSLEIMEKQLCDAMGMTTQVIAQLYTMDEDTFEDYKTTVEGLLTEGAEDAKAADTSEMMQEDEKPSRSQPKPE